MAFYEIAQKAYQALEHNTGWFNFDEFDKITVRCRRDDYEYRYCESELYVIRHKHMRWFWFAEARSPGEALSKCLARGFESAER